MEQEMRQEMLCKVRGIELRKKNYSARHRWLISIISATQEADIGRTVI
jgi:hypothetical protein